jgi:hypothetical protein
MCLSVRVRGLMLQDRDAFSLVGTQCEVVRFVEAQPPPSCAHAKLKSSLARIQHRVLYLKTSFPFSHVPEAKSSFDL